ncbi:MAG: hypothetical protein KAJ19_17830 [Gammaproteobacteria bacterium]|nr:hypothetical protein [Gammaproteobacteria bacterium]
MIKKMGLFVKIITFGWARAICIAPFGIYIREEWLYDQETRRHELDHWPQQTEMLYIFYYVWYLLEWIVKLFIYGKQSYYNISFEREARAGRAEPYGWIKYL